MAIAFIQSTTLNFGFSVSPQIVTISPTLANSLIVVSVVWTPQNSISVIDNMGNIYHNISGAKGSYVGGTIPSNSNIFYSEGSTSGVTTITVTFGGSTAGEINVAEFSGVKVSGAADAFGNTSQIISSSYIGPALTTTDLNELLITCLAAIEPLDFATGANSPWIYDGDGLHGFSYTIQNPINTYQCTFTPAPSSARQCSSGITFFEASSALTINLSDSVSSNDSSTKEDDKSLADSITSSDALALARAQNVSDSTTITDSFSIQSNFIAPNPIPSVESLTDSVVPAEVKTFWKFQ